MALAGSDSRPRIHLWKEGDGFSHSHGPVGLRVPANKIGDAVEAGLAKVNYAPTVIIWEGASVRKNG